MTYRHKLLLKKALIVIGIILLAVFVIGVIGFRYLGRYVVYTEDGAYFSFNSQAPETSAALQAEAPIESPVLVTGDSLREASFLESEERTELNAEDIQGLFLDYATLTDASAISAVDLTSDSYNALVLEMRVAGSDILDTSAVRSLIARASDMRLIAMISCLDDSDYALSHSEEALQISGGALWLSDAGSYYLDPTQEDVQDYLASMITQLQSMGFDEVILNNFNFPESLNIEYTSESSRSDLLVSAYESLQEKVNCTLGILVKDTEAGHQAFDAAEHLYVYFTDGSGLKEYMENYADRYIVFLTSSHDTRFDDYGKIYTEQDVDYFSSLPDVTAGNTEESDSTAESSAAPSPETTDNG